LALLALDQESAASKFEESKTEVIPQASYHEEEDEDEEVFV
jgi:hypothetical protein